MKINIDNTFCPVCGYGLGVKIFDYENDRLYFSGDITGDICPSCGCEFDYNLFPNEKSYMSNRIKWIILGMQHSSVGLREMYPAGKNFVVPKNWNPITQLKNIGIDFTDSKTVAEYKKDIPNIEEIIKSFLINLNYE